MKKKKILLLTNGHDWYVLEDKTSQKKFPSVCLSVCLDVWMSGCTYVRGLFMWTQLLLKELADPNKIWCRSGIEIQSNIMILILILIMNRILTFTKTLRSYTKFGGYL